MKTTDSRPFAKRFGAALLVAGAAVLSLPHSAVSAQDSRYRTYGPLHPAVPYRVGHVSVDPAREGPDFVSLGKLDGNDLGPYGNIQDVPTIARRYTFLVDWIAQVPTSRFHPAFYAYEAKLALVGAGRERSKQEVLCAQLAAEAGRLDMQLQSLRSGARKELVFEIANEPNLYPYFSPELYAWYLLRWRTAIVARAQAFGVASKVKVMNGGLWWSYGLPATINKIFATVLGAPAADAGRYYRDMLVRIGQASAAAQPANCRAAPVFARISDQDAIARAARLIDVGNVHFYPWLHESSPLHASAPAPAAKLAAHVAALRSLTSLASSSSTTGEVWLTEVGNINPYAPEQMVAAFLTPFLDGLESLGTAGGRGVTRWYWYLARGEDPKFSLLNKVGPQLLQTLARFPTFVAKLFGVGDLPALGRALVEAQAQNPRQGLADLDGTLRPMGRYYLQRAKLAP